MRTFFFYALGIILSVSFICFIPRVQSIHTNADEFAMVSPATANEEAILDQLQLISYPTLEEFFLLEELLSLDPEEQQIALNQLAALPYTHLFEMAEINLRKFVRRLYTPLRKIVVVEPEDRCGSINKYRMGTWFDVGYDRTHIKANDCFQKYLWKGCDVSFGVQGSIDPLWTLGFAGSYEHDRVDDRLGTKGTNQTFLAGAYSLFRPDDYYLFGDFVAGYSRYSVKRCIDIDPHNFQHKGKPELYQSMIYLEGGYDFPVRGCLNTYLFQPFLGFEIGYFRYRSFHEKTAHPFFDNGIAGRSHVTFNGRLGIHFNAQLFTRLSVAVDAAWQHRCTSFDNHIRMHFCEFGDVFSITGIHLSHDSFDGAVNITLAIEDNLLFFIEATGQIWNRASTYNTFAGIQLGW